MSERYAPEATAKDKRVQDFAYNATEMLSIDPTVVRTVTESRSIQPEEARVDAGRDVNFADNGARLEVPSFKELDLIKQISRQILDDATKSDDIRAAAEIMESIADRQKEILDKQKKGIKVRHAKSAQMFNSINLFVRPAAGSKAEEKLEQFSEQRNVLNDYLNTRFSTTLSFTDKLLSEGVAASKSLAAPVQREVKYSDL